MTKNGSENPELALHFAFTEPGNVDRFMLHVGAELSAGQLILAAHHLIRIANAAIDTHLAEQRNATTSPLQIVRNMDAVGSIVRELS